jgi:hypothetical protein
MVTKPDSFTPFDEALAAAGLSDPWVHGRDEAAAYQPDYGLLE